MVGVGRSYAQRPGVRQIGRVTHRYKGLWQRYILRGGRLAHRNAGRFALDLVGRPVQNCNRSCNEMRRSERKCTQVKSLKCA